MPEKAKFSEQKGNKLLKISSTKMKDAENLFVKTLTLQVARKYKKKIKNTIDDHLNEMPNLQSNNA